ncbi:MFS transporter, partial [Staphylococcus capitis]
SKFNISDKEGSNESTMESETATTEENLEDNDTLISEVKDQSIDNSDETTDADHQNINPNSEEAKVNEKLKEKHSSFMFGKG